MIDGNTHRTLWRTLGATALLFLAGVAQAAETASATSASRGTRESSWSIIAPFFQPPAEFAGQLGSFRSPLLFNDGSRVKTSADWLKKREEIAREWKELMGPWPAIIERPKIETLSVVR